MAGTFLRFDFKLFLIIWPVAVLNNAVLKFADAPNIHSSLEHFSIMTERGYSKFLFHSEKHFHTESNQVKCF